MNTPLPTLTDRFSTLAAGYDVVLSDVWGVVHNGLDPWPAACAALAEFRRQGGAVVLISNAPRPGEGVIRQIDRIGVPREAYDAIVTSGDVTRSEMSERAGEPMFHIGPERDIGIFKGLDAPLVSVEEAAYVVCTGLVEDDTETPDDYADVLAQMRARDLLMVCGNPDLVVERGDRLLYCAGALADRYAEMGGAVVYAGKPHRPIYDLALAKAAAVRGEDPERSRVLAIGDSIRTDVTGAQSVGIDALFVTNGIHAEELGGREAPDMATLGKLFDAAGVSPRAVTRTLAW